MTFKNKSEYESLNGVHSAANPSQRSLYLSWSYKKFWNALLGTDSTRIAFLYRLSSNHASRLACSYYPHMQV
jgi:hypothetical protein